MVVQRARHASCQGKGFQYVHWQFWLFYHSKVGTLPLLCVAWVVAVCASVSAALPYNAVAVVGARCDFELFGRTFSNCRFAEEGL